MNSTRTTDRFFLSASGALGVGSLLVFLVVTVYGTTIGAWKLLGIGWVAFVAMAGAAVLGGRTAADTHPRSLVWGYGLASGAMVTSASVFLLPTAFGQHAAFGGFGLAAGILVGFASHTIGHRAAHLDLPIDTTAAQLTAHAISAGAIIGIIYGNMPELGPLLGLAIVSHKGPAGYAAATRLARQGRSVVPMLLPAAGVGIAAVLSSAVALPASASVRAVVFGFAAGIFLHIAVDFLPRCEFGSEIHDALSVEGDAHELLDRLRVQAVLSTTIGGAAVFVAWLAV